MKRKFTFIYIIFFIFFTFIFLSGCSNFISDLFDKLTPSDDNQPINDDNNDENNSGYWFEINDENSNHVYLNEYYGRESIAKLSNKEALLFVYDKLVAGVENSNEKIDISSILYQISKEELEMVYDAYRRDYSEHFWLGDKYSFITVGNVIKSVSPTYTMRGDELQEARKAFINKALEMIGNIPSNASEYERELVIHDRLCLNVEYDLQANNAHNAYGALVQGKAVCEGYAKAYQYLLRCVGIKSFIQVGSSLNPSTGKNEGHAWNLVRINNEYYHVDTTWDDSQSTIYYAYFNLSDEMIMLDHQITSSAYELPKCTANTYNFFVINHSVIKEFKLDQIVSLLKKNYYTARIYVDGEVSSFITWFQNNILEIASKAGVTGKFKYGYMNSGNEVIIYLDNSSAIIKDVNVNILINTTIKYTVLYSNEFNSDNLKMRITIGDKNLIINKEKSSSLFEATFILEGIEPIDANDNIKSELIYIDEDNNTIVLDEKNDFSIKSFCDRLFGMSDEDLIKESSLEANKIALFRGYISDYLEFSTCLQKEIDPAATELINDIQNKDGLQISEYKKITETDYEVLTNNLDLEINNIDLIIGHKLSLVFGLEGQNIDKLIITENQNQLELKQTMDGKYYFTIDNISIFNIDKVYEITITNCENTKTQINYSVKSLVYSLQDNDDLNSMLLKRLYCYAHSLAIYYENMTYKDK